MIKLYVQTYFVQYRCRDNCNKFFSRGNYNTCTTYLSFAIDYSGDITESIETLWPDYKNWIDEYNHFSKVLDSREVVIDRHLETSGTVYLKLFLYDFIPGSVWIPVHRMWWSGS